MLRRGATRIEPAVTAWRSGGGGPKPGRFGRAYQGAFEAVIAIVVGGLVGAFADSRLDTTPLLLIVGLLFGFGAFVLRLVRLLKQLAPKPEDGQSVGPNENGS